jgi:hypothetical protein
MTIAAVALTFAALLRIDNTPIYVGALVFGFAFWVTQRVDAERVFWVGVYSLGTTSIAILYPIYSRLARFLSGVRSSRAHGTTAYLTDVTLDSVLALVAFSWIGFLYFYFTPFPWMISTLGELVLLVESLGNIVYFGAAIFGSRLLFSQQRVPVATLVMSFLVFSILYGNITANVGAAARHRQMFSWVLYLFGGVWLASRCRLTV